MHLYTYTILITLVRSVDSEDACIYAEIRTRIPETVSWDYNFEPAGSNPISFTVKVGNTLCPLFTTLSVMGRTPRTRFFVGNTNILTNRMGWILDD